MSQDFKEHIETSRAEIILEQKLQEIEQKYIEKVNGGPIAIIDAKLQIKNNSSSSQLNQSSSPLSDTLNNIYNVNAQSRTPHANQQQKHSPGAQRLSNKRTQFQQQNQRVQSQKNHQYYPSQKNSQFQIHTNQQNKRKTNHHNLSQPSQFNSNYTPNNNLTKKGSSNYSPFIKRMETMDKRLKGSQFITNAGLATNSNVPQYKALLTRDIGVDLSQILQQGTEQSMSQSNSNFNSLQKRRQNQIDNDNVEGYDLYSSASQFPDLNSIESEISKEQWTSRIGGLNGQGVKQSNSNFTKRFTLNGVQLQQQLQTNTNEPPSASKYKFRVNIKNTASVIKVNRTQRVIWSPDDIKSIQLKKPELNWIFNNVKNNQIQKQINYYQRDIVHPTQRKSNVINRTGQVKNSEKGFKRAVIIIGSEQMLNTTTTPIGQQKDTNNSYSNSKDSPLLRRTQSLVNLNQNSTAHHKVQISYMQVVPKELKPRREKRLTQMANSLFKTNDAQQQAKQKDQSSGSGQVDSLSQNSLSEASLIKKGTELLTKQVLKELILNQEGILNQKFNNKIDKHQNSKQNNPAPEKDSWQSDEDFSDVSAVALGLNALSGRGEKIKNTDNKNYQQKAEASTTANRGKMFSEEPLYQDEGTKKKNPVINQILNQFEKFDSLRQIRNQSKKSSKKVVTKASGQADEGPTPRIAYQGKKNSQFNNKEKQILQIQQPQATVLPDLVENYNNGDAKINIYFYHNKTSSPKNKKSKKDITKSIIQKNQNETTVNRLLQLRKQSESPQEKLQQKKISRWRKLRNIIGSLMRLKSQEAIQILTPDQIIDEINKISLPKPSLLIPNSRPILKIPQPPESKTSKNLLEFEDLKIKQEESKLNDSSPGPTYRLGAGNISMDQEALIINSGVVIATKQQLQPQLYLQLKTAPLPQKRKINPPVAPKVREIDYFRKIRRFFEYAARGSQRDEKRMLRELKDDYKKHMRTKEDPEHLINIKNAFGKTPLFIACECGNLNIVKLLIQNGANVHIKSKVDQDSEETNLQCAARWRYFEIVKYLAENIQWSKQDLRDTIQTENLQKKIKHFLVEHYQERYGKNGCFNCCFNFWNR